jgi:hypothetical protein
MKQSLAALAALVVFAVPAVRAEEHLVSPQAAQRQLLDATAARAQNLAAVDAIVASPQGSAAMATLGVDAARVRGALSTLTDAELQEVASRASALQADPVAGAPFSSRQILWIVAIVVVVLIIIAIA